MSIRFLVRNTIKIALFKVPHVEPYGAFANTTAVDAQGVGTYPIYQELTLHGKALAYHWPSAEHAYHAQKLIDLKKSLSANHKAQNVLDSMLSKILNTKEEYNPRRHYDVLVTNSLPELRKCGLNVRSKLEFDTLCNADYHYIHNPQGKKGSWDFMKTVIKLKFEQHQDLRDLAMQCAKEGIIPVEISQYDNNWASGPEGTGQNLLGKFIYEEGCSLLRAQGEQPAFEDVNAEYNKIPARELRHNTLSRFLKPDDRLNPWAENNAAKAPSKLVSTPESIKSLKHAYKYSTLGLGRTFFFKEASIANLPGLKSQYCGAKGDRLKTKILLNFRHQINMCTDQKELNALETKLRNSDEYKVLSTVQGLGLYTRLFKLKTSSQEAADKLFESKRASIPGFKP